MISLYVLIDLLMHLMPREPGKCIPQGEVKIPCTTLLSRLRQLLQLISVGSRSGRAVPEATNPPQTVQTGLELKYVLGEFEYGR